MMVWQHKKERMCDLGLCKNMSDSILCGQEGASYEIKILCRIKGVDKCGKCNQQKGMDKYTFIEYTVVIFFECMA